MPADDAVGPGACDVRRVPLYGVAMGCGRGGSTNGGVLWISGEAVMRTRREAVEFITHQLDHNAESPKPIPDRADAIQKLYGRRIPNKRAFGYGKVELRHLLDYLYGRPPAKRGEEL